MAWKLPAAAALLLGSALALAGCESKDPCILRQAACLDIVLIGKQQPVYYRKVTITITAAAMPAGAPLVPVETIEELRATAAAGVQGLVTFRLPDSYNELMDLTPDKVIGELKTDAEKIARLEELRAQDPRALRILIEGTEVDGMQTHPIGWDSREEEELRIKAAREMGNPDPWLRLLYHRVGRNQYLAVYALLQRRTP
ncbi:MAG: hypothetical protein RMK29_00160 [Myxococcales bacterium]|nr:hypothetical protein [Myxococcota bacterium]MDW8280088.1 hypothetical protein [Myxococcales bacterium]